MVRVDDWVRIDGGTAAVGEIGNVTKVTKVMAAVRLHLTGVSVNKKQKFLTGVSPPAAPAVAVFTNADEDEENCPPVDADLIDILVNVPDLTDENRARLLNAVVETIEAVSGRGTVQGKGLTLRGMGQFKFRMSSPEKAALVVRHYTGNALTLEGQNCSVSFAEAGQEAPSNFKNGGNQNHRSTNSGESAPAMNVAALPAGRTLADRFRKGTEEQNRKRRRRW